MPPSFQFHKGAIRTLVLVGQTINELLFQFHKGAIRTGTPSPPFWVVGEFQFHKGAIRTFFASLDSPILTISIP